MNCFQGNKLVSLYLSTAGGNERGSEERRKGRVVDREREREREGVGKEMKRVCLSTGPNRLRQKL